MPGLQRGREEPGVLLAAQAGNTTGFITPQKHPMPGTRMKPYLLKVEKALESDKQFKGLNIPHSLLYSPAPGNGFSSTRNTKHTEEISILFRKHISILHVTS